MIKTREQIIHEVFYTSKKSIRVGENYKILPDWYQLENGDSEGSIVVKKRVGYGKWKRVGTWHLRKMVSPIDEVEMAVNGVLDIIEKYERDDVQRNNAVA